MSKEVNLCNKNLSIILGAVGGAGVLVIIAVIVAVSLAAIAVKRRKKDKINVAGKGKNRLATSKQDVMSVIIRTLSLRTTLQSEKVLAVHRCSTFYRAQSGVQTFPW